MEKAFFIKIHIILPSHHPSLTPQKYFLDIFWKSSLKTFTQFKVHVLSSPSGGGVLKVFITNLPSTCWLARISGQFCDGSFSKSVINTKTAHTPAFQSRIIYFSPPAAQLALEVIIQLHQQHCHENGFKLDPSGKTQNPIFMSQIAEIMFLHS